jgi:hypothetical protein
MLLAVNLLEDAMGWTTGVQFLTGAMMGFFSLRHNVRVIFTDACS